MTPTGFEPALPASGWLQTIKIIINIIFPVYFVWVRYLVSHTEGRIQAEGVYASHKSKPSSLLRGIVDSYSALPWVTWEAVTFVEDIPWWVCHDTCWLTGLWSTQAKVEGIVLKAAWHWGRDCSVITIPVGNQAAPNCMQAFRLRGAPWPVTLRFSPYVCTRAPFWGLQQTYMNEWINEWMNRWKVD